ncbi:unnamed protein product [Brachionus calyciflorus]|uniref:DDE Tnp4 domain-containing protein n=1 Tax=Brachionus calyciflorus TaxID=104777 RepID=A0A813WF05_9BILA|nr:unnamed protein product [Brachionus calyciflorus]
MSSAKILTSTRNYLNEISRPSSSNINIEHVAYSSICDSDDKCLRIKEFEIRYNFSNNSFEKNLPIIFGSFGKSTSGFYPPNGEFIESSQENYSFYDEMAIICDGTYTRLEKSSNNIICCPDGWIIHCYGPLQATENDASILKYILKIDNDLKDKLIPKKSVIFLDRGFRDILSLLKDYHKFDCKIPTCQQLEPKKDKPDSKSRQLTVKQTSDTKIVTKCRFMVEKQIGMLKNNKALDNIRNTEAGHIMIDYRICCSMINFDLKPSCPDGKNAEKIATKILIRSQKKENDLEFLLGKHLDTKSICPISFSEILDFQVSKRKSMKNNIFLGSYQFNQAKARPKTCHEIQENYPKPNLQNQDLLSSIPNNHNSITIPESKENEAWTSFQNKSLENNLQDFINHAPKWSATINIEILIMFILETRVP